MNSSIQNQDNPLSSSGRFGRLSYAAWIFLSSIIAIIVLFILVLSTGIFNTNVSEISGLPLIAMLMFGVVYITFLYLSFVFTIRRLHDRNQSGWLSLLVIVPLINLFFMIYLFCAKGTTTTNSYGPPRMTQGWEKVLGWIYILLIPLSFVSGIIAAIAIPAYQDAALKNQQMQIEQQLNQAE